MEGLKSVLFVTGLCSERCFYCPISPSRRGKDVVFINDVKVDDIEKDVFCEIAASGSKGVGITGGDPLIRLDRTIEIIKNLKDVFGDDFHIHLYTAGTLLKDEIMSKLVNAGLDEIRVHVISESSWRAIKLAVNYPISVGIENPVIPGSVNELKNLIIRAHSLEVDFVNLNELEFSEGNYVNLRLRGIKPRSGSVAAEGSEELAIKVIRWVEDTGIEINLHYCPAVYKDRYQYARRLMRRALNTKFVFEEIHDGLVRWANIISCPDSVLDKLILTDQAFTTKDGVASNIRVAYALECIYRVIEALPLTPRRILNKF